MNVSESLWHSYICKDFGLAERSGCRELGGETGGKLGRLPWRPLGTPWVGFVPEDFA